MVSYGYDLPKSNGQIKKLFMAEYDKIKSKTISKFKLLKVANKFSISFDETTSIRNRRYLSINVHQPIDFQSLGLVRIVGSVDSKQLIELVTKRLEMFSLDIKCDIVATITDGASIMKKFGKDTDPIHVMCMAHAIHLSVTDMFFTKKSLMKLIKMTKVFLINYIYCGYIYVHKFVYLFKYDIKLI